MKTIYVWTGEYREPLEGEYVLPHNGGPPIKAEHAMLHSGFRYWILSRHDIPDPATEVDDE